MVDVVVMVVQVVVVMKVAVVVVLMKVMMGMVLVMKVMGMEVAGALEFPETTHPRARPPESLSFTPCHPTGGDRTATARRAVRPPMSRRWESRMEMRREVNRWDSFRRQPATEPTRRAGMGKGRPS